MKKLLILGGALTVVGGVYFWGKYQSELAKQLVYKLKNAKLRKVGKDGVVAEFDFEISNSTEINLNLSSIDIDVFANDTYVTKIQSKKPTFLGAKTTSFIPLVLDIDTKSILSSGNNLFDIATSLNSTVLRFKGTIKINKFGINIPVPFSMETTYGQLINK